jgi:hypothetical protein
MRGSAAPPPKEACLALKRIHCPAGRTPCGCEGIGPRSSTPSDREARPSVQACVSEPCRCRHERFGVGGLHRRTHARIGPGPSAGCPSTCFVARVERLRNEPARELQYSECPKRGKTSPQLHRAARRSSILDMAKLHFGTGRPAPDGCDELPSSDRPRSESSPDRTQRLLKLVAHFFREARKVYRCRCPESPDPRSRNRQSLAGLISRRRLRPSN